MSACLPLFSCCLPGRRRSQDRSDAERTPLLPPASSGHPHHASAHPLRPQLAPPAAPRPASSPASHEAAGPPPAAATSARPAYTVDDLATITGWARTRFISVRQPDVFLEERRTEEKGKARPPMLQEVKVDKSQATSAGQPDEQLKSLVDKLARGVAFDGWSGEGWERDRDRDARSESDSDNGREI